MENVISDMVNAFNRKKLTMEQIEYIEDCVDLSLENPVKLIELLDRVADDQDYFRNNEAYLKIKWIYFKNKWHLEDDDICDMIRRRDMDPENMTFENLVIFYKKLYNFKK